MNIIDVFIVLFLLTALFRGREVGFVRQICSTVGFFGGLWLGAVAAPFFIKFAHTQASRSIVTLGVTLGGAFLLLTVGEYIGIVLKTRFQEKLVNRIDNGFGSILAVVSMLVGVWLSASILLSLPSPGIQSAIRSSAIASTLIRKLPPATTLIADISHLIDPNGFPQVFNGNEPAPPGNVNLPALGEMAAAVQKDRASVVKIEGQGCGGIVEGSGFIAGNNIVVTNAHVVAGISTPYVSDSAGTHPATAIWFDPNLDMAVLRVDHLTGKALPISAEIVDSGTPGVVLGYPNGGGFSAKAAAVIEEFTATGRNIYNAGNTNREIYEIKADIVPGNSGGPLVDKNGTVIGVVFAQSTAYNHVGYALTTPQVNQELAQATKQNRAVSTGTCAE